jgi:hypothetical protein
LLWTAFYPDGPGCRPDLPTETQAPLRDWCYARRPGRPPETQQRTADFMHIEVNEALLYSAGDPRGEIARLEERIEQLAETLSRCGKFRLASQVAMAGGGLWFAAAITGLAGFDPVAMLLAIAGVIGGTVMYGSNAATVREVETEMKEAEGKRAVLIGALDLRMVEGSGVSSRLQ